MVKAYGLKLRCYWEHHGGTAWELEERFGTSWELDRNMWEHQEKNPFLPP
jgi:hypothetical protein